MTDSRRARAPAGAIPSRAHLSASLSTGVVPLTAANVQSGFMPNDSTVPVPLSTTAFSVRDAAEEGVPRSRLRAACFNRHGYGVYSASVHEPSAAEIARVIAAGTEGSFVSHESAAQLHGLWLPSYLDPSAAHVSRQRSFRALRRQGVVSHAVKRVDLDTVDIDGVSVSTPARVFLELASSLHHDDLVALGDQIVRVPRKRFEGRATPHATPGQLHEMLRAHPGSPGYRRAAAALACVRIGADSGPETKMRLAVVREGFPEPELQVALDPRYLNSWLGDLGYTRYKIVLQYDGGTHLDLERQVRDHARDDAFSAAGWIVIHANRNDLADGFVRILRELRSAFRQRGVVLR